MTLQLLTIPQTADRLGCSRTHVYRLIASGELRSVEIKATGKRPKTRVRADDLEVFIEANTTRVDPARADELLRQAIGGGRGEVRRIDGT